MERVPVELSVVDKLENLGDGGVSFLSILYHHFHYCTYKCANIYRYDRSNSNAHPVHSVPLSVHSFHYHC